MKLLLIRHAESEGNVAHHLQGQQEDPLSPQGHHQAQQLGHFLRQNCWQPTHLYSSPLQRTLQTAQYCSRLPIQPCSALLEIHNGVLQGLTWSEAQRHYPDLCQQLSTSLTWIPIPKAESPHTVVERSQRFIRYILSHHQNCDRLWVFSHGGVMQHLIAHLMGCDRVWGLPIPPTGLFEFEINLEYWDTQGCDRLTGHLFKMIRFNQTPHLTQS